jgi:SsrA-binding protein
MSEDIKEIVKNKKANFEYHVLETFEAGMVLKGTEVQSIRQKKVNIQEGYAFIKKEEAYITGMNITPYEQGNRYNHEPLRERKLLLHKSEIKKLNGKLKEKGLTLVPLKLYFKNGKVKLLLGLAKGKAEYDKRESIQKRESDRELQRMMKKYK